MTDDLGVWLYAVTRTADGTAGPEDLTGVAGESPRPVRSAELTAVVGSVPLAVFGDVPLRRNLEDLDWLEATARAHDAVVSALLRCGPVVPLRLATVFLDDDRVVDMLEERRGDFESALTLVNGRTEWGVKAYCDRAALTAAVADAETAGAVGGKGTAYLARRRAQLSAQENVERDAAARASEIHGQLVRRAAAGRCQPLTDPVLHGRRDWLVLNGTYLVDDTGADEFAAAVAELDRTVAGIRLELTGPWPPYSFAGVDRTPS
ncbi:GvpL/GvpF family gas vesicle protein [Nocardia flavorosea]|uniref:GvpL/GvpF family gas vesicle protein n=1 Tax=Nocardia flavorosea TaxID=53429 RepID=A0A846YJS3_9NOCA|nr:GvpL/GvpF family gas vesicle protein [Nocardia flavorosea]NKY57159.1 GvpL/GvpF family gas vesicle protein [Nocardia flavorosea]